jgi:hypothetical protein
LLECAGRDAVGDARERAGSPGSVDDNAEVIRELDLSLAVCLQRWLPADVTVGFEAPAASWLDEPPAGRLVDAFLYDVREEPSARVAEAVLLRDENGRAAGWQAPIRRFRFSYLVSAWCGGAAAEHELLAAVLVGCVTETTIPVDCLVGVLAGSPQPVLLQCAPAERPVSSVEVWASLTVPSRTALDVLVVASVIPELRTELAPSARSIDLGVSGRPVVEATGPSPAAWPSRRIRE